MTTLIEKLATWREELLSDNITLERERNLILMSVNQYEAQIQVNSRGINDIDRAIAAIEQPADAEDPGLREVQSYLDGRLDGYTQAIESLHPPIPDEQPELFEDASVAFEQLETDHALPPSADDVVVEEAPQTVEEAPALNEAMQDEREQGYAPVTNPEADFWAQTLTEQPKPEPFRLTSIFRREKEEA